MSHRSTLRILPCLALSLSACTGLSLGENAPDSNLGAYLEGGRVAVDPTTETTFTIVDTCDDAECAAPARELVAVRPGASTAEKVLDLTGRDDARLLFVEPGILSMAQSKGRERLELLDRDTFEPLATRDSDTWYWGTRISGSRRWIAVADNAAPPWDLHLIDAATLKPRVIPHGGEWLETMFTHAGDRLVSIVFAGADEPARLLVHDLETVSQLGFSVAPGSSTWVTEFDVPVPNVFPDAWFSFTWVGISPDDRLAVFPVLREVEGAPDVVHSLLVLDLETGNVRTIDDAKGPVGFSPDGSTIVSYGDTNAEGDQALVLIDAETLERDVESVPIDGGVSFFVSHQGAEIVVASNGGKQSLVLVDIDAGTTATMAGPGVGLEEFVSRESANELWLVDESSLYVADLDASRVDEVKLDVPAEHIGILPQRDEIVVASDWNADEIVPTLHFLDPSNRTLTRSVPLR
jgi:hypothetical protein